MRHIATRFVGAVLAALTASAGAMAQSYYDDQACRHFADAQIAPLRDQANSQAIAGTLLGAGLGAALGAAVGGEPQPWPADGIVHTTHNAWRRGDIHQRNIADRRRDMRRLRDILQRQAMDCHQAIRAARPAMT